MEETHCVSTSAQLHPNRSFLARLYNLFTVFVPQQLLRWLVTVLVGHCAGWSLCGITCWWLVGELSMIVLHDCPAICDVTTIVSDPIVCQRGSRGCDSAVRPTEPDRAAPLPKPSWAGCALPVYPSATSTAFTNSISSSNAWHPTVSLGNVHGAARFVKRLERVVVFVATDRTRTKVAQRPSVFV